MHHAFVIEAEGEKGISLAYSWIEENLKMKVAGNPDIVTFRFGLFSAEDARRVCEGASQAPFVHESKAIVISASRVYHEAQNNLLKLFEEPPPHTYLFFIMPSLGGLLPTLRSRVHTLRNEKPTRSLIPEVAEAFMNASKEKRSAIIKKLAAGRDEEERREKRDEAIAILNGIEYAAYQAGIEKHKDLLEEIGQLRAYLYTPSASLKMILEHISLVLPRNLL